MDDAHAHPPYRTYWVAWLCLLTLTILMVSIGSPAVLLAGIAVKAGIIGLWFMHLKYERPALVLPIALGIFATAFVLFGLIAPDGWAC